MARMFSVVEVVCSLLAAGLLVAGVAAMTRGREAAGTSLVVLAMVVGPALVLLLP